VKLSKKYASLYPPLVERIVREEANEKAAKTKLHAIYGAYGTGGHTKAEKLLDAGAYREVLNLHASTREREGYIHEFYAHIFNHIGNVRVILDIGCGFNPFTIPFFPKNIEAYHALDICLKTAALNNRLLNKLGMPALADCQDAAIGTPDICADAAFLFKLLPVLEQQKKGRGASLLYEIKSPYIVITYPTRSLSGRNKGMETFYAAAFDAMLAKGPLMDTVTVVDQVVIGNETVIILYKPNFRKDEG
jgi:16S rRNA (guanine(1405)-N(7))-methyltransferase